LKGPKAGAAGWLRALRIALVCVGLAVALTPPALRAEPVPLNARAIWARGDRVYIALLDTLPLPSALPLTFRDGKRTVATAVATGERAGEVLVAMILTGSLEGVKRLDRLVVLGDRSSTVRAPRTVRWGYPSPVRRTPLFACDTCDLRLERLGAPYRIEEARDRSYRLVHDAAPGDGSSWPDTIVIRLYDDASDQEIAFERGEIDAAVFWPGEASRHARALSGPMRLFLASREWGVLVAAGNAELSERDFEPLDTMNEALFRGDLVPYLRPGPGDIGNLAGGGTTPGDARPVRFEVDEAIPGARLLRRALPAGRAPEAEPPAARSVRLFFLPVSVDPDSIALPALPAAPGDTDDGPRSVRLFTLGCPVLAHSSLVPFFAGVGVGPLVNLFECRSAATHR
jgi:hypothetical protein